MATSTTLKRLFREKQFEQITSLSKAVFKNINSNWDDLPIVVRSYLALGRIEEACFLCEHVRTLDEKTGDTVSYYVAYTECLRHKGQNIEAIEVYEKAIANHPNEVGLYLAECELLDMLGRRKEAKARLTQVLKIEPDNKRANKYMEKIGERPNADVRPPVERHCVKREDEANMHLNLTRFNPLVAAFSKEEVRECQQVNKKRKLKKLSKLPCLPEVSQSDVFEETLYAAELGLAAREYQFAIHMLTEVFASEESRIRGEAYKLLGEIYFRKGMHDSAEAAWLSCLEYGCTESRVYVNLVKLACKRNDHVLANQRLIACRHKEVPVDRIEQLTKQVSEIKNANQPIRLSMDNLNCKKD